MEVSNFKCQNVMWPRVYDKMFWNSYWLLFWMLLVISVDFGDIFFSTKLIITIIIDMQFTLVFAFLNETKVCARWNFLILMFSLSYIVHSFEKNYIWLNQKSNLVYITFNCSNFSWIDLGTLFSHLFRSLKRKTTTTTGVPPRGRAVVQKMGIGGLCNPSYTKKMKFFI